MRIFETKIVCYEADVGSIIGTENAPDIFIDFLIDLDSIEGVKRHSEKNEYCFVYMKSGRDIILVEEFDMLLKLLTLPVGVII